MDQNNTILIVGTYDTKHDELTFLENIIRAQGGRVKRMDVSVLGDAGLPMDFSKHDVAAAAGMRIEGLIAYDDENTAFQKMAAGASALTLAAYQAGDIDGMIALGGTMGTDLALDVAASLPMGVPKYIVSTVAFSPLIAPHRIAPDVQMILWAGGLYGLNSLCKSTLAQAAGAVVGAVKAAQPPTPHKPMVGMTSLGKTALRYMVHLLPELQARGFEVAVFHATGLGGRAFETLIAQGRFACVMDFCLQEFINGICESPVASGPDRLHSAARHGVPQMVAPGACDIIDILAASAPPPHLAGRDHHAHNRLIDSVMATETERENVAKQIARSLGGAKAPVQVFLPLGGMIEWDKPGMPLHNPKGHQAFLNAMRRHVAPAVPMTELACHINDMAFAKAVLDQFDRWVAEGIVQNAK